MTERVDVCIVGSGFGGSISAYRLAELYRAAGQGASVMVLERGPRHQHTDFRQSMDIDLLSRVYGLIQGQGAQIVVGNGVGGGSNLYLAASLRSPRETFERRDHRPEDGPDRRMWPAAISRDTLNPYYARAEAALRVQRPTWKQVAKSGGLWAASLAKAGHTCDRVPLAIDLNRCIQAKWCHTGCIYGAKNSVITNYLPSAEQLGVQVRPNSEVELIRPSPARPYRYVVSVAELDNDGPNPTRQPTGNTSEIECKVLILSGGAMGNAPLLMRSRPFLPSLSAQLGKHLGINGDHIAGVEYDEQKVRDVLGLPGYGEFYKGNHITTMSYDWWVGRSGHEHDGKRFTLQEIYLSGLAHILYDDGRGSLRRSVLVGPAEEAEPLHLEQPRRGAGDGRGHERRRVPGAPAEGRVRAPEFRPDLDRALQVRALGADRARARGRERGDQGRRRASGPRAVHEVHVPYRERIPSAGRLPDGRLERSRRRRPPQRGVRLRGPLLHRLLRDSDLAGSESLAHDLGRVRARRRPADRTVRGLRAAGQAERVRTGRSRREPRATHDSGPAAV